VDPRARPAVAVFRRAYGRTAGRASRARSLRSLPAPRTIG
jgi:hypothetical protein